MSAASEVLQVAKRDFLQRARSKAFLIMTALTVGLVLVMAPLLGQVLSGVDDVTIGLAGEAPAGFADLVVAQSELVGLTPTTRVFDTREAAEDAVLADEVDVLVVDGNELVWRESSDLRLETAIVAAKQAVDRAVVIDELGLTVDEAGRLLVPEPMESTSLEPPDPDAVPRMVVAQLGGFLLYMGIIIFGQFILMGVMEEKQNRVIEVILSRIPPTRLLAGKIVGIGLLGLLQIVVLGGAIWLASTMIELPDVDLSGIGLGMVALVVFWYVLGFGLYAVLYGAMGATVSRQEDAQGAVLLPTLVIVVGYMIASFSVEDPDGMAAIIGSFVPLTAPVVMPFRMAVIEVPLWQVLVSAGLVMASTWGMVRLGARVYSGAVLSVGKKVRLRDAWRASRAQTG